MGKWWISLENRRRIEFLDFLIRARLIIRSIIRTVYLEIIKTPCAINFAFFFSISIDRLN